jgi:ribonuclease D
MTDTTASSSRAPAPAFTLVQTPQAWAEAAQQLRAVPRLALDVEADGFHRYPEHVALLQIAVDSGSIWLVDPLALEDLSVLGRLLADQAVQVVAHAASYDVRSLDRDFRFAVRGLFDTAIAAQFCGARQTGLAHVAERILGIELAKPKRLQRYDWSTRPLAAPALAYAADDVRYLLALADGLTARLAELGREDWVAEECRRQEAERYRPPEPPESACLSASGCRQLSDRGRAVLRELFLYREAEARRFGRPPYRIMSEAGMVQLAAAPDMPLDQVRGLDRRVAAASHAGLQAALTRGLKAPALPWPASPRREVWPRQADTRLRQLKDWRNEEAEKLDLDPGIVWPADHLKQVALHPEACLADLDRPDGPRSVRRWQWAALGASLEAFRRTLVRARPAPG